MMCRFSTTRQISRRLLLRRLSFCTATDERHAAAAAGSSRAAATSLRSTGAKSRQRRCSGVYGPPASIHLFRVCRQGATRSFDVGRLSIQRGERPAACVVGSGSQPTGTQRAADPSISNDDDSGCGGDTLPITSGQSRRRTFFAPTGGQSEASVSSNRGSTWLGTSDNDEWHHDVVGVS